MKIFYRKADLTKLPVIWDILQGAIRRRKDDGSDQWQDGYPNPDIIKKDIEKGTGFVLSYGDLIVGYAAVSINDEPEYANIKGEWITNGDFLVFHRVALSELYLGRGLARKMMEFIEEYAINNGIYSIKADTNFDNAAMLSIFEKLGYKYCGEVSFRGSSRKAYEKVLFDTDKQ